MSHERLIRTEALLGSAAMERLDASHILLVGLGGVGGHALDALVRSGVGRLTVCDHDTVSESNLNRQMLANRETVGRYKAEVSVEHAARLSDRVEIIPVIERLTPESAERLLATADFDFVIDAIDDVAAKVALAVAAERRGVPILSCLGTGNRLDPGALRFADIEKTSGCPLARAVRTRLRRAGGGHLRVLVSDEPSQKPLLPGVSVASSAFVPTAAGLMLAAEAVRLLVEEREG